MVSWGFPFLVREPIRSSLISILQPASRDKDMTTIKLDTTFFMADTPFVMYREDRVFTIIGVGLTRYLSIGIYEHLRYELEGTMI
jgi:hypothetical protein